MRIKYTNLLASLMLLMVLSTFNLFAGDLVDEDEIKQKLPLLANGTTNIGKEYWFSIPPVYENESGGGSNFIKVFVISIIKTKVTLNIPKNNYNETKETIPNEVIVFDIAPNEAQPVLHDPFQKAGGLPSTLYPGAGIGLVADEPILVYVVCRYRYTSDGFLPIPVTGMGKDYVLSPYSGWSPGPLFPAFSCIVAAYDSTKVSITMGGSNGTDFNLEDGRTLKTGQSLNNIFLRRGDVYMLSAKGQDPDISGTRVKSTKPIGIVSGQICSNIPIPNRWCDYTVEMELPVSTWGTVYHVPYLRGRKFNGLIRIFAKEANTDIYRNGQYWFSLTSGGTSKGNGWSEQRIWPMNEDGQPVSPKLAVITANKPIGITFYNPGIEEDNNPSGSSDPFSMVMTPIDHYQKEILFNTPNTKGGQGFTDNFVNLIYETDENGLLPVDYEFGQLSGGKIVWKPIGEVFGGADPKFFGEVNNRKYANKNFKLPSDGIYRIRGSRPFAAYSYGFSSYESYGYPTSAVLSDLTIPDIENPEPKWTQNNNGNILDGTVTDMPNDPTLRSNLNYIQMLSEDSLSYNYKFQYKTFEIGSAITTNWSLEVINPLQNAKATLLFSDKRGNDTISVIKYNPPVQFTLTSLDSTTFQDYELVSFENNKSYYFKLINLSATEGLFLKEIKLKFNNQGFKLEPLKWDINLPFKPFEQRLVEITFTADTSNTNKYLDSIGIGDTSGFEYFVEITAETGVPSIDVSDWDFKKVNTNIGTPRQATGTIRNNGNGDLRITGFTGNPTGAITTDLATNFNFVNISESYPLIIQPGKSVDFRIDFKPTNIGTFNGSIIFNSNIITPDNVCQIIGEGINETSINEDNNGFNLSSTIPNPVNGNGGNINYSVGFAAKITIKLFDIEGNLVETIVDNDKMPAGNYSISIPIDRLNSGIYFYQMESGPFKSTEKLVIQK